MIKRLTLILTAVSLITSGLQAADKPNIIFVLADDHAWEAVSAYGSYLQDFAKTPAIDRLAAEGTRFDNFVCANSICSPSRASFITGQYSHLNGVKNLNGEINDRFVGSCSWTISQPIRLPADIHAADRESPAPPRS